MIPSPGTEKREPSRPDLLADYVWLCALSRRTGAPPWRYGMRMPNQILTRMDALKVIDAPVASAMPVLLALQTVLPGSRSASARVVTT